MARLLAYERNLDKVAPAAEKNTWHFLGIFGAGGQTVIHMIIYAYKTTPTYITDLPDHFYWAKSDSGWIMKTENVFGSSALQSSYG